MLQQSDYTTTDPTANPVRTRTHCTRASNETVLQQICRLIQATPTDAISGGADYGRIPQIVFEHLDTLLSDAPEAINTLLFQQGDVVSDVIQTYLYEWPVPPEPSYARFIPLKPHRLNAAKLTEFVREFYQSPAAICFYTPRALNYDAGKGWYLQLQNTPTFIGHNKKAVCNYFNNIIDTIEAAEWSFDNLEEPNYAY